MERDMLTFDDPDRSLQGNDGASRVEGEDGASFAAEDEPNELSHAVHEAKDHEGPGEEPLEDDAWDADFSEDDERAEDDVQEDEEFPAGISLAEDDIEDDEEGFLSAISKKTTNRMAQRRATALPARFSRPGR